MPVAEPSAPQLKAQRQDEAEADGEGKSDPSDDEDEDDAEDDEDGNDESGDNDEEDEEDDEDEDNDSSEEDSGDEGKEGGEKSTGTTGNGLKPPPQDTKTADKKSNQNQASKIKNKEEDEDDDEEDPAPGSITGFINTEVEVIYDWLSNPEGDTQKELSASISGLANWQVTEAIKLGVEMNFETDSDGEFLALESPSLLLKTLNLSYEKDWGGIAIGKMNPLNDNSLVNSIWERSFNSFDNFPSGDTTLGGMLGVRGWLDLNELLDLDSDHYVYGNLYFRDRTLSRSVFTQRRQYNVWHPDENSSNNNNPFSNNLANTGKPNSWLISLHGKELPFTEDWEYSLGVFRQAPGFGDVKRELGGFAGLYGEYEWGDSTLSPFTEFLHRDGADGQNQTATSAVLGLSLQFDPWTLGISYSHRHSIDHDDDNAVTDDSDAQLIASYNFPSGLSVDLGYQFLKEDGDKAHGVSLAISIPFEFSTNVYGGQAAAGKGLGRNNMKRLIRR